MLDHCEPVRNAQHGMAVFKLSGRHTMATLPTEDEMKLDDREWLALAAALLGAIFGTVLGALFFLFIGV